MHLKFTKMHGLGNDFVVIDGVNQPVDLDASQISRLADRHFGIGFDQLLLVEAPVSEDSDFRYRIFNADGSEVAQCGNGARCFARFVYEQGLCDKTQIRVDTDSGRLVLTREANGSITVDMGIPRHRPDQIPLASPVEQLAYHVDVQGRQWEFGAVSMGNPHAVLRVDSVEAAPVCEVGAYLERHELFPARANIGFMAVENAHRVQLRVFERGSGETLACGSGACAAVVIGIERGWLTSPVEVELPGGTLQISWSGRGAPVIMTGPATTVFEGSVCI